MAKRRDRSKPQTVDGMKRIMVRFDPEHFAAIERYLHEHFKYPPTRENFVRKVVLEAIGLSSSTDLPLTQPSQNIREAS